jgi:putative colanic acid biosysnthesis UDP-glucose lipid carrier transferase
MRPRRQADILALSLWLLPMMDTAIVIATAAISSIVLTEIRNTELWPWSTHYQVAVGFAAVLTPFVFHRLSLYRSHRGESLAIELIQVTGGWLAVLAILAVIAIATKTNVIYSRLWMAGWLAAGCLAFWAFRIILRVVVARLRVRGWDTREIVMVGSGVEAARVVRRLRGLRGAGYRVIGYFSGTDEVDAQLANLRRLGSLEQIHQVLERLPHAPDQAWIALPAERSDLVKQAVQQLAQTTLDCRLVPDTREFNILNYAVSQVAGLPVINLSYSPMTGVNRAIKAIEDRLLALLILTVIAPLMILIALAVKLDSPGPVLFRQRRHGWNGEEITVLKFRTMVVHREKDGRVTQASKYDPRITRLGKLLRRTSLDELPQFLNVLGGSMSVVGPRPHAVEHNEMYKKLVTGYVLRHKVKPGITGWAQVNGYRGETESLEMMRRRIEYDLYYIEHWSIWLDLTIVALTCIRGFVSSRAY